MKKLLIFILPILTACYITFVAGMFIGRHNITSVQLSVPTSPASAVVTGETTAPPKYIIGGKLNINTATLEQLKFVPGIGDVTAQRILDYRDTHGPFTSLDDLDHVEGLGQKRIAQLSEYITIGGSQ